MANISSINGNPIVVGESGLSDGAVTNDKLSSGGIAKMAWAYFGMSDERRVDYNATTHILTLPVGFVLYGGKGYAFSSQTIDVTSALQSGACMLCVNSSHTVYAIKWGYNVTDKLDCILGYIYNSNVVIFGVPQSMINVHDDSGNIMGYLPAKYAYIGIREDKYVTYNYQTKTLSIPQGFYWFGYDGGSMSAQTIDVSSKLRSDACMLWLSSTGAVTAGPWNTASDYKVSDSTALIGYIFRRTVVISGIPDDNVEVIDPGADHYVYCFGDSITAGVGATTLYHMLWHSWLDNYHFKNYGIGSTGYCVEANGTYLVGGGVEGKGTSQEVTGANTVIEVMQSVTDTIENLTISAGTNDWSRSIPAATFRTAVQACLDYALTRATNILVMTPIRRQRGTEPTANDEGMTVEDYGTIVMEECELRGIPYCDGYGVALNPANPTNCSKFVPDGLHPNDRGQARIARHYYDRLLEGLGI